MIVKLPGSGVIRSSTFTSCILPSEIWMNEGILPRKSIWVCIFTAAFVLRKCAHGNTLSERSIVVVSRAYKPECFGQRGREYRGDKAWLRGIAGKLRCHAGFLGTSVAQTPCIETDQEAKMSWSRVVMDIAEHNA